MIAKDAIGIGPELWYQKQETRVGEQFERYGERHEVVTIEAWQGGYLITTKEVKDAP